MKEYILDYKESRATPRPLISGSRQTLLHRRNRATTLTSCQFCFRSFALCIRNLHHIKAKGEFVEFHAIIKLKKKKNEATEGQKEKIVFSF